MGWVDDKPIGKALVVGGGPAGALAAKALADRNYNVIVCEAYPHPKGSEEKRHAYVISLNARGQRALRRVGVAELLEGGVQNDAYVRHGTKPDSKPKIIVPEQPSLVIRRQKLTTNLLALAEQSGATICCGEKLVDIDFDKKVATFVSTETGKEVQRSYDLLVGADGVKSVTRTLLENRGLVGPTRKEADDMEYQVAVLPHWRELLHPDTVVGNVTKNSTHTWNDRTSNSNSLVFPLDDGKSLVCVICPSGKLFDLKTNEADYGPFLQALYPNWTDASRKNLASQLAAKDNVVTTGGTCIWTSTLASPNSGVVLVGDSGHGMWPSLGQGCNAALESSAVLADAVDAVAGSSDASGDVHSLIAKEFDKLRHEDGVAIVDLTFGGIGSRRTRGMSNGKTIFFLQVALTMLLHKVTFKVSPMPALLRVMSGDDVPYSKLLWQNKFERLATYGLLVGIAASAGIKCLRR